MGDCIVSEHEADGCEAQESERLVVEALSVSGEPSAATEPREDALDDPALEQYEEPLGLIGSLDDLYFAPAKTFFTAA